MKHLKYILSLFSLILFLQACDKDSELELSTSNISGKWVCSQQKYNVDGKTIHTEYMEEGAAWMQFKTDGSGIIYSPVEFLFERHTHPYEYFEWSIESKMLITDLWGYMEFKILSLTDEELILECPYSDGRSIVATFHKEFDYSNYDSTISVENLSGKWVVIKAYDKAYKEYYYLRPEGEEFPADEVYTHYLELNSDGTGYKTAGSADPTTILGSKYGSFSWVLEQDNLIFYDNFRDIDVQIVSFEGHTMVLESIWDKIWFQKAIP